MGLINSGSLPVDIPQRRMGPMRWYTATENLYFNSKRQVVGHKDPDKQEKLVSKGGQIPLEDAERYGLLKVEAVPIQDIAEPIVAQETLPPVAAPNLPVLDVPIVASDAPSSVLPTDSTKQPEVAAAAKNWNYSQKPKRGRRKGGMK